MDTLEADKVAIFVGEHVDAIMALMRVGFFDMRNGSFTVHFGNEGTIRKIEKHNVFSIT